MPAARMLVASLLVGVQYLVGMVAREEDCRSEKIRGFHRLDRRARLFICLAASFTSIVHAFELDMLADDRFLLHGRGAWIGLLGRFQELVAM